MKTRSLYLSILIAALISGCGGGGGGEENPAPTSSNLNTGVLIDSAVEGVSYHTETQAGTTNSQGEFSYKDSEIITFSIGALSFPPVTAIEVITPLTLAGASSITNQQATNIARLLQSLDEDGDPRNGIKIPSSAALVATSINFDVDTSTFEANPNVTNLVANSGSINTTLVSVSEAQVHLGSTLNNAGIVTDTTTTGVGAGTVKFSGPGTNVHPLTFTPTEFHSIGLGPTGAEILTWANDKMTITVTTISNNLISKIATKTKNTDPVYQWDILLITDPINSTYDGSTVTFAGDTLSEINLLAGDVIINGSLTTDSTEEPTNSTNILSGSWTLPCQMQDSGSVMYKFNFNYSGENRYSITADIYSDNSCQAYMSTLETSTGTYSIGSLVDTTSGVLGYEFDVMFDGAGIVVLGSFVIDGQILYLSEDFGYPDRTLTIDFTEGYIKE